MPRVDPNNAKGLSTHSLLMRLSRLSSTEPRTARLTRGESAACIAAAAARRRSAKNAVRIRKLRSLHFKDAWARHSVLPDLITKRFFMGEVLIPPDSGGVDVHLL